MQNFICFVVTITLFCLFDSCKNNAIVFGFGSNLVLNQNRPLSTVQFFYQEHVLQNFFINFIMGSLDTLEKAVASHQDSGISSQSD